MIAAEIEFTAEDELVTIISSTNIPKINLIEVNSIANSRIHTDRSFQRSDTRFRPLMKAKVPLWLAINLKKRGKCSIQPPEWLDIGKLTFTLETLTKVFEEEEGAQNSLYPINFHYLEISRILLESASDDIQNSEQIKALIKDIKTTRQKKIAKLAKEIDHYAIQAENVSMMEMYEIRPFLLSAFDELRKLNPEDQDVQMGQ